MNFVDKLIQDLREEYKHKEESKTAIELMYITRTIRKGNTKYGTN